MKSNFSRKNSNIIFIHLILCLFILSCSSTLSKIENSQNKINSKIISINKRIFLANGGQKIQMPQLETDTQILWAQLPITKFKLSKKYAHKHVIDINYNTKFILSINEEEIINCYIEKFHNTDREITARTLQRAKEFMPMIIDKLRHENLPSELACIPLIESAFEVNAISSAGAAGLWQLMPETAKRFGLIVNENLDERYNAIKSTNAAIQYLTQLYLLFKDWSLAIIAYNAGEGKIQNAIRQTKCNTYQEIIHYIHNSSRTNNILNDETIHYIPKLIAAINILSTNN